MINIIAIALLVLAVGSSVFYIVKEKKNGKKCIGCPCSGTGACHCKSEQR